MSTFSGATLRPGLQWNKQISSGGRLEELKVQAERGKMFLKNWLLRCLYKRLVNYKFLVGNKDTLREIFVYAKLEEIKATESFWKK